MRARKRVHRGALLLESKGTVIVIISNESLLQTGITV